MTDVLTLAHIGEMKRALASAAVPMGKRTVILHKSAFKDWCEALGLDATEFKTRGLGNGILEVYV